MKWLLQERAAESLMPHSDARVTLRTATFTMDLSVVANTVQLIARANLATAETAAIVVI